MNSAKKKFLNRTNFYGQLTAMDKSGRILIPAILRESARMTGEVAVLGNLSNLEIWNHERFVSSIKEDGFSESDMESLGLLGI
jgi:MraZ protein